MKIGTLTGDRANNLRRIRDRGAKAWREGADRPGSVRKMFRSMAAEGLCSDEPFEITEAGRRALDAYDAEAAIRRQRREPLSMLGIVRYG